MEISKKAGKTESFLIKSPPQAENFEDFRGVFARKTRPKCTQEGVFGTKPFQNASKFSACGGHIIIKIRLNAPNVFFRACGGQNHNVLSFMLVYRASLDKHKTLGFASLAAGQNHCVF